MEPVDRLSVYSRRQTLVYDQLKIVLVLTSQRFDFREACAEWDDACRSKVGAMRKIMAWLELVHHPIKTVMGERAYQKISLGAHPRDGYPCRVSKRPCV